MGVRRRIHLQPHSTVSDLEQRYRAAKEPHERSWWQILWLLAQGRTVTELAGVTGYSAYGIGPLAMKALLKEKKAVSQLAAGYGIRLNQLHRWREIALALVDTLSRHTGGELPMLPCQAHSLAKHHTAIG